MKNIIMRFLKFLFVISFAGVIFWFRWQLVPKYNLTDGVEVRIEGEISEEPFFSGGKQKLRVGQFEAWVERYPEYHYGEKVVVKGKVKIGRQFQIFGWYYKNYLLKDAEVYRKEQIFGFKKLALSLKLKFLEILNKSLPPFYDGIVAGIVLGDKSLIGKDFWNKLRVTGTLHIIVASGMNIALMSRGILRIFFLFLRRKIANLFLLILIWFYSIMIGFNAPIVRAAVMFSLVILGEMLGREIEARRVLWLTGFLMILINPILFFDTGFWLSFLATTGLIYFQSKIKRLGQNKWCFFLKNENFSSTLSAQLTTLPVLAICFGEFNLLSVLINLIILWAVPFILQLGILAVILGILWIGLAKLAFFLIFPLLFFIKQTIEFFANFNFGIIKMPKEWWFWGIWYLFLCWWGGKN